MRLAISVMMVALLVANSNSQEPSKEDDDMRKYQAEAAEYQFSDKETSAVFEFRKQPVFRWTIPIDGSTGCMFVWTYEKVPMVIGSCYTVSTGINARHKHAFHVLTERPILGRHRDEEMWSPDASSVQWHTLVGAPEPAINPTQRTIQLRSMARRFRAQVHIRRGLTECRLVPQPFYRFESETNPPRSGAIFAYAVETDPDALIVFDLRKDESGKLIWKYSLSRDTYYRIDWFLDDRPLYTAEESENLWQNILLRKDYQKLPHINFRVEQFLKH